MNLFDELQWRAMVSEATEGLADAFATGRVTAYIGFDPTASSLHVGSLLTVMGLARLQRFGHAPIAIVGGGTGMIGDPSGKSQERVLLSAEQIDANVVGIRAQLERFLDFDTPGTAARIVNNADWLATIDLVSFLRDAGKHFTVNYMMQKESVSRRLESEDGISFTEFSYLVLQAYDFLQLFDRYGCTLQMGGTDQWGNITAGIDLIRKVRAKKAHGLVWPLMKSASGAKFGKTEAGTIWLDAARTPVQEFRQFWLNTDDRDVIAYLKFFTFLTRDEVDDLEAQVQRVPEQRAAQQVLADQVTTLVHGREDAARAESANAVLFGASTTGGAVDAAQLADSLLAITGDVPSTSIAADEFEGDGLSVVDVVARATGGSKSEARRLVQQGGVSVNDHKIADANARLTRADALDGRVFLLRKGSRQRFVIRLT
uniref:Tyrosine--tRNA ligase n=1 Tax=uncultured bacterium 270 TaxID=698387 RepID=E3T6U7_9BACT|nr:putative tyrosyl-tRNA synthetase [uncultured bacterium 270]